MSAMPGTARGASHVSHAAFALKEFLVKFPRAAESF
jgi:hypothetical protein